jgi:hypothetical protein
MGPTPIIRSLFGISVRHQRRRIRIVNAGKSLVKKDSQRVHKAAALTAMLFQQADVLHHHASIDGFAHVVDGE